MVEQRSPKPMVESSSLSAPATPDVFPIFEPKKSFAGLLYLFVFLQKFYFCCETQFFRRTRFMTLDHLKGDLILGDLLHVFSLELYL